MWIRKYQRVIFICAAIIIFLISLYVFSFAGQDLEDFEIFGMLIAFGLLFLLPSKKEDENEKDLH